MACREERLWRLAEDDPGSAARRMRPVVTLVGAGSAKPGRRPRGAARELLCGGSSRSCLTGLGIRRGMGGWARVRDPAAISGGFGAELKAPPIAAVGLVAAA